MPGIVGMISYRQPGECQAVVESMTRSLQHEKFYVSGMHAVPELAVYAGWVAHEHSFASTVSMIKGSDQIAVLFSGECYAESDRAEELSRGAAHWLFTLYGKLGDQFVEKLNGLFSGLLIDKARKKILLFNDRYGFSRIYWHSSKEAFYFASEAKALLRTVPELRAFDDEGVAQFLSLGNTIENRTLFRGIQLLPAASVWSFEHGECCKRRYFSATTWESQPSLSSNSFQEEFEATLKRVVPRYCESVSRIGISLTAGLDSRMLMACLPEKIDSPICYTYAGQKGETLDARLAEKVAEVCNLKHIVLRIAPDFFSDFAALADRTVYLTDGCCGILGAHEIYLNRQARELAPIRLTGVFGGEVLRSVSTFKPINLSGELFSPELRRNVGMQVRQFASARLHPVNFAAFKEIPWSIFGILAAACSQVGLRTPYLDNEVVALAFRTPENTRRSPETAVRLIQKSREALAQVPTDMGLLGKNRGLSNRLDNLFSKATFKLDYLCNDGMPHLLSHLDPVFDRLNSNVGILGQHKYLRYRRWFRKELADYITTSLSDTKIPHNHWNEAFVRNLAQRHKSGEKNYLGEINAVLTLNAVERLMFRAT